jgi:ribose transport system permease protein
VPHERDAREPVTAPPESKVSEPEPERSGLAAGFPAYRWRWSPSQLLERFGLLLAWGIVVIVFGVLRPDTFLTWGNFSTIFGSQAVLVVLALGLLIPLTAGDYDLSIAGVMGFGAMLIAVLNGDEGWPIGLAILVALLAGALIGLVNGSFVILFGIDSIIVTLGTGTFVAGLTLWISDSRTISGVSEVLVDVVVVNRFLGIPLAFYYGLGLGLALWYLFEFTAVGRRLLFVGRGRRVARLSGVNVDRLRWGALVASGTIAAVAGVLFAGTLGGASPTAARSFLLPAFAAAFLGATTIVPGRFNPWGTIAAVYFLVTGITGLTLLGVDIFVQDLFYGGALVLAVALSQIARRRAVQD